MESHIGPRLAQLAQLRGKSTADIAAEVRVHRSTVSRWLTGAAMTVGQVEQVLAALLATPAERAMVYEPPPPVVEACTWSDDIAATCGICPTCGERSWVCDGPESECDGGGL